MNRRLLRLLVFLLTSFVTYNSYAQNGAITGRVLTADGKAAAYVNITLNGSSKGATVNSFGQYTIKNVVPGSYQLSASYVGLATESRTVEVRKGETVTVDFTLKESSNQLNEVVVSSRRINRFGSIKSDDAAKLSLGSLENSQSYSTVNSALMADQGVYNLDDALKNVPGANKIWAATDRAGFGNGASFVIRGFQLNTYLRNGIPANVSTTIDNANIESFEVIKGPSATLFGSAVTSYGGLINRVTKKPFDHFGGEIAYTGGSYGFNRLTADINTPFDSAKNVLFRVNTALNTSKSWQDAGFHRDIFVAPSLYYKASDRLSFNFDAEIYESIGTTPQMFFFNTTEAGLGVSSADKLNLDYSRSYLSNDLSMTSSNLNFSGQMNYKISDNWTSRTNISVSNTNSYGPMPYFYLLNGNNTIQRNVWEINGADQTFDVQENIVGKFTTGPLSHRLLLGIDYYNYNVNVRYNEFMGIAGGDTAADLFDVINTTGKIANYYNFNKKKVDSAYANGTPDPNPYVLNYKQYISSAYASDVINITDNLIANAALRVDHFDYTGSYDPTAGTYSGGYNQTHLAPKFGLVYQPVKDRIALFGNYQTGFTNETGADAKGNSFKPEQSYQWEGGVKLNAFKGRLSGTISYYDIHVKDIIRTDPNNNLFSIQNGTEYSKGVEVDLVANPIDGLNITAGYAHNKALYTNADPSVDGLRPNASGPADMANFWVSYRFVRGAVKGLGFGFGGNYAGKAFVENATWFGQFTVPEYTLLNASVYYDAGKFRLSANVNNLTNKKYWIGWYTVNPQQPLAVNGSIAFRF